MLSVVKSVLKFKFSACLEIVGIANPIIGDYEIEHKG